MTVINLKGNVTLKTPLIIKNGDTLNVAPGTVINCSSTAGSSPSLYDNLNKSGGIFLSSGSTTNMNGTEKNPIVVRKDPKASNSNWSGMYFMSNNKNTSKTVLEDWTATDIGSELVAALTYGEGASKMMSHHNLKCVVVDGAGGSDGDLNSVTFGGATCPGVEKIMVLNGQDDGIECFGGELTLKQVAVSNVLDDAIDADQGAQVTVLGAFLIRGPDSGNFIEAGGSKGKDRTRVIGTNVNCKGEDATGRGAVQTKDFSNVMVNGFMSLPTLTQLGSYKLNAFGATTMCVTKKSSD